MQQFHTAPRCLGTLRAAVAEACRGWSQDLMVHLGRMCKAISAHRALTPTACKASAFGFQEPLEMWLLLQPFHMLVLEFIQQLLSLQQDSVSVYQLCKASSSPNLIVVCKLFINAKTKTLHINVWPAVIDSNIRTSFWITKYYLNFHISSPFFII